jgi:hypothetical protein
VRAFLHASTSVLQCARAKLRRLDDAVDFMLLSGASMIALGFAAFGIDESVSVECTTPSSSVHEEMV